MWRGTSVPSEAERAVEYRRMVRARGRNKRATERALRGDAAAKAALEDKTKALLAVDEDGVRRGDVD